MSPSDPFSDLNAVTLPAGKKLEFRRGETFLLTIVGTTMTRTGIVQSVHAFGQDNTLLMLFSVFMLLLRRYPVVSRAYRP